MRICRLIGEEWDTCTWFECLCCKEKWAKDCPIWNIIQVLKKQNMTLQEFDTSAPSTKNEGIKK